MRRTMLRAVTGASIAVALVVFTAGASMAAGPDLTRPSRTLVGVGSDTTFEVMQDLDTLYARSPGCAVIPPVGTSFTDYKELCIDGGQLSYASDYSNLISSENLYHDRFTEAFPVGSGNGTKILTQYVTSPGTALAADYARASSKQTYAVPAGNTAYGVAFARDGLGYWLGKNNVLVKHAKTGPTANVTTADLKGVFVGNSGGQCLINYSSSATDSIASTLGAPGGGNIDVFATQVGSGTGKDFLSKIDTSTTYSDASALQNCIPTQFKDGDLSNGEHVIFENNAAPICKQAAGGVGTNHSFQSTGIFPYSFARFTQNKGTTGLCPGKMGKVAGVAPTVTSIGLTSGAKAYPLGRYVYNYFVLPNSVDVNDPSTWTGQYQALLNYMNPTNGWLCKSSGHAIDPVTGTGYRIEQQNVLKADGFAPLVAGPVGGSTWSGNSVCRDAAST